MTRVLALSYSAREEQFSGQLGQIRRALLFSSRGSRGFTLLEILITIMLISLGLFPLLTVFSQSISVDRSIEGSTVAVSLAQEKIEGLRGLPLATINNTNSEPFMAPFDSYTYAVTTSGSDPAQITVTVGWNYKGEAQQMNVTTLQTDL